jgi:hypothetical protein
MALCESSLLPSPAQDHAQKRGYHDRPERDATESNFARWVLEDYKQSQNYREQSDQYRLLSLQPTESNLVSGEKSYRDREHGQIVSKGVGCGYQRRRRQRCRF